MNFMYLGRIVKEHRQNFIRLGNQMRPVHFFSYLYIVTRKIELTFVFTDI